MAKRLNRLSARTVATLTKPGRHADGGCLYLVITKAGAKRWTFLYGHLGQQREAGLGSVIAVSLAEARQKAAEYRLLLARGIDPLGPKEDATVPRVPTFGELAEELFASKRPGWRSVSHAQQWQSSMQRYTSAIHNLPNQHRSRLMSRGVSRSLQPPSASRAHCQTIMSLSALWELSARNSPLWRSALNTAAIKRTRRAGAVFYRPARFFRR